MLLQVSHFTYATALDIVMGYYNIKLSVDASKLCTIITPFGKYEYLRLPMGVSVASDRVLAGYLTEGAQIPGPTNTYPNIVFLSC